MKERDLLGGLIRLHVLHHACREPIFGLGIMEELARHGYKLSAGTLYPILHGLERAGYLVSEPETPARGRRRTYVATSAGREALLVAKAKVRELFKELFEEGEAACPDPLPTEGRIVGQSSDDQPGRADLSNPEREPG